MTTRGAEDPRPFAPARCARRTFLGGSLVLAAAGCGEQVRPPARPSSTRTGAGPASVDPAQALAAGRELLEDAMRELTAAFPGISWTEFAGYGCEDDAGGATVDIGRRRCPRYLGRENADIPLIQSALTRALEKHGLPAAPTPTGGTGGWLTTASQGKGLRLEFASKGQAELRVDAFVTGSCASLPTSSS